MRRTTRRLMWAAVAAGATAGPVSAQATGNGTGTGGTGSGLGGSSSISGNSGGGNETVTLATVQSAPTINAPSTVTTTTSALSPSNFLARTSANPYYQGSATATISTPPGGFGIALYGTAGTGTGGNIGSASSTGGRSTGTGQAFGSTGTTRGTTSTSASSGSTGFGTASGTTGRTGTTGGFGTGGTTGAFNSTAGGLTGRSTGGLGGAGGGGQNASSVGGQIVPPAAQIAYTAVLKFDAPVAPPSQVAADLRGVLDRSDMISNPRGVRLDIDANTVVLRGAVKDEEEARTVEGMVRLTPGVAAVRNELTFPKTP